MKKFIAIFAILGGVIAITLLGGKPNANKTHEVNVQAVENTSIQSSILASGTLTHEQVAHLTPELIGKVKQLMVVEGDEVKQGQLVLQIDDEEYAANVGQKRAQVNSAELAIERAKIRVQQSELKLRRQKALYDKEQISSDTYEEQSFAHELLKVDHKSTISALSEANELLRQAEKGLSKTKIFAPFDGVVTAVDIKVGETAIPSAASIPGSELMTIANPDSTYTEVNVDEADIGNVGVGDSVKVVATAFPDTPINGTVKSIATSAKVEAGRQGLSFRVKISLEPTEGITLRPGMSCRAEIFTRKAAAVLAIPLKALIEEEDKTNNQIKQYVFVNRDGIAHKIQIGSGISDDENLEVTSGLELGDQVIIGPDKQLQNIRQGDAVTPQSDSAS